MNESFEIVLGDGITIEDIMILIRNADHVHQVEDFEPNDLDEILHNAKDWMKIRVTIEKIDIK